VRDAPAVPAAAGPTAEPLAVAEPAAIDLSGFDAAPGRQRRRAAPPEPTEGHLPCIRPARDAPATARAPAAARAARLARACVTHP
jgi:hypothetical protein